MQLSPSDRPGVAQFKTFVTNMFSIVQRNIKDEVAELHEIQKLLEQSDLGILVGDLPSASVTSQLSCLVGKTELTAAKHPRSLVQQVRNILGLWGAKRVAILCPTGPSTLLLRYEAVPDWIEKNIHSFSRNLKTIGKISTLAKNIPWKVFILALAVELSKNFVLGPDLAEEQEVLAEAKHFSAVTRRLKSWLVNDGEIFERNGNKGYSDKPGGRIALR